MTGIKFRSVGVALAAGLMLAALSQTDAAELQHVSVRLDWLAGADHAALFLAKARGFYKDAGLDVELNDGKGSLASLQAITAGNDDIGLASLSTMAIAVGKGVPLVAIAGIIQKAPDSVIALKGSGITSPKDLEGKRWGFIPDDAGARMFPAFAAANNIDVSTITKIQISYSTLYSSLIDGNVDFVCAWASPDAFKIAKIKPIEPPIIYADHGVNTLGTGIFVTKDTLAKKADMLKAFLAATVRGAAEAEKNPDAAIDAIIAERPSTDRAILAEEYSHLHEWLHTPNSQGHVFGWMADADWQQTIQLLTKYFDLPSTVKVADVYTNDVLPSE